MKAPAESRQSVVWGPFGLLGGPTRESGLGFSDSRKRSKSSFRFLSSSLQAIGIEGAFCKYLCMRTLHTMRTDLFLVKRICHGHHDAHAEIENASGAECPGQLPHSVGATAGNRGIRSERSSAASDRLARVHLDVGLERIQKGGIITSIVGWHAHEEILAQSFRRASR